MKRPEGFDPQARRPQPAAPTPPPRQPREPKQPREAQQPKQPRAEKAPRVAAHPEPDVRAATRELRKAERARKRFERGEVKRFTRRTRERRAVVTTTLVIVGVLVVLLGVAVFSPLLSLKQITVDGTSRVDKAEVLKAVDGQLGTPLALIDLARIEKELSAFPLIRSFVTETVPPNTLVIHIVEREPVGVLATDTGFQLIDPAGVVVQTVATRPDNVPLIQVSGEAKTGDAAFESTVEVLLALPSDLLARVDSISASTKDDVTFELRGDRQRIVWGSVDESAKKARVLEVFLSTNNTKSFKEYDVSSPDAVVVSR